MRLRWPIIFTVILLTLAGAALLINRKGNFSRRNTSFAAPKGTGITRVEMRQGEKRLILQKSDVGWSVNESGEARKSAVGFLLQILSDVSVKSPVSEEVFNEAVGVHKLDPVSVRAYSGKRKVTSFIVYRTGMNRYGNIALKSHRGSPFILHIPGYEGDIGVSFTMNEDFWRPFNIFNERPSSIEWAEVFYPSLPDDSFRVDNRAVTGNEKEVADTLNYNEEAVTRFISYFTWVPFESWETALLSAETDSVLASEPFAVITVGYRDGSKKSLRLWYKSRIVDGSRVADTDRAWGAIDNERSLFVVRYFDVDPLLRKRSYFSKEE